MPKPPDGAAVEAARSKPRSPTKLFAKLPRVAEYLTDVTWPDGSPIGNVQLSVRTRGGLVVAQLKLAAMGGLRLSAEATCLDDALAALEAACNADPAPWEPDPYPLDGVVKKKK